MLQRIKAQLPDYEKRLDSWDLSCPGVSTWSVGDHLEHLLISHQLILDQLEKNLEKGPGAGKPFTLPGRLVLFFGRFPRGWGKAPEFAKPTGKSREELEQMLERFRKTIEQMEEAEEQMRLSKYTFPHFAFGEMSVKQWLRLIEVHTRHHIRIADEIIRGDLGYPQQPVSSI